MGKIGLVLVAIIQSSSLYSMELSNFYTCGKTKINIKEGAPWNEKEKVRCIVVEINEQKLLEKVVPDEYLVGHITFSQKAMNEKRLKTQYIHVVEPLLYTSQYSGQYYYYVEKQYQNGNHIFGIKYYDKEAFNEASKDLALCYKNVLIAGMEFNKEKNKSIVLPMIGKAVGFPKEKAVEIAVSEIFQFIMKSPQAYSCIDVCVGNSYEAQLYKDQLSFYCDWKEIKREDVNRYCIVS